MHPQQQVLSFFIGITPRLGSFPSKWFVNKLNVKGSLFVNACPPNFPFSLFLPGIY